MFTKGTLRRRQNQHEDWESRRAYYEAFKTHLGESEFFPSWPGTPDHCKCGCGGVWHRRGGPVNWWYTFNPGLYASIARSVVVVFLNLQKVLWSLPPVIRQFFGAARAAYTREAVLDRVGPDANIQIAMVTGRIVLYGVVMPLLLIVWLAAWLLSGPGVVVTFALFVVALTLTMAVFLTAFLISLIAISASGLVFIIGGVGSILYFDNPIWGILVIVLGVFIQYEIKRREVRRNEEQLGLLILTLRQGPKNSIDTT